MKSQNKQIKKAILSESVKNDHFNNLKATSGSNKRGKGVLFVSFTLKFHSMQVKFKASFFFCLSFCYMKFSKI